MLKREEVKQKIDKAIEEAKVKAGEAYIWCKNNREVLVVVVPVLASSAVELVKVIARRGTVAEQKRLKDNYIYDRRSGHYYEVRRKLKNSEWIEFDERRNRGENVGQILRDMRVLK